MHAITTQELQQIREEWDMTQAEFAHLLGANLRTFQGWESGRPIPATVAQHVATIQKLRTIYQSWDAIATPLAGTEEYDAVIDDHEKLWDALFPELKRL